MLGSPEEIVNGTAREAGLPIGDVDVDKCDISEIARMSSDEIVVMNIFRNDERVVVRC